MPWATSLGAYAWQVALHSAIGGVIFYLWAHRLSLPSGQTKRRLLALLLALPMVTAAVPGRSSIEFGERLALFSSARVLAVPLPLGFHVHDGAWLVAILAVVLTLWQEVAPALRRPRSVDNGVPASLRDAARLRSGWRQCRVTISPSPAIMLATAGIPGRPRLIVSQGAVDALTAEELDIAIAHEHAHWRPGRWWRSHALFALRVLQCYSPVALWVFREYCAEVEVACDADAVAGRDPHVLARVLLRVYKGTARRDIAARAAIRKRVDVLLGGGPQDQALPPLTLACVSGAMLLVLPWIV